MIGTAAACSKVRFVGFGAILSCRAVAYSANDPLQVPKISSPGANRVTPVPTASTVPAKSLPPDPNLRLAEPVHQAEHVRKARHDVPVADEEARGADADEHLALGRRGPIEVLEMERLGRAVRVLDDCSHGVFTFNTDDSMAATARLSARLPRLL